VAEAQPTGLRERLFSFQPKPGNYGVTLDTSRQVLRLDLLRFTVTFSFQAAISMPASLYPLPWEYERFAEAFLRYYSLKTPISKPGADRSVNDNVLYHSLLRLASPQQVWGHCPRWGRFAQADCPHEKRPMTFLDPSAFPGPNP
jgi:hypothetical protein